MSNRTETVDAPGRADLVWRIVIAVPVGYVLTNMLAIALGIALPVARVDAAQIGLLSSFLIYAAIVMRAFSPVTVKRLGLEMLVLFVVSGLALGIGSVVGGMGW